MKATSLIETIFSMLILAICITMGSLLFFALTSYEDRIEDLVKKQNLRNEFLINDLDVVQKQKTIIEYNIKWGTKK